MPISSRTLDSFRHFFRNLEYENFVNRPLSSSEIREVAKLGTHPNLTWVLSGSCTLELRQTETIVPDVRLRRDLILNQDYLPYLGQARGPLNIYDPESTTGEKLPRLRIYVPVEIEFKTQEQWFDCFSKPSFAKHELRWEILSLAYFGEEYFEVQVLIPVFPEVKEEDLDDKAINLALVMLEKYFETETYPNRLNFTQNDNLEILLGEERLKIKTKELVTPTQGMIIDVRTTRKARALYEIGWKEKESSVQTTFTGGTQKVPREIVYVSLKRLPLPSTNPADIEERWRGFALGKSLR